MLIIRWKESLNVSIGTRDNTDILGLEYENKVSGPRTGRAKEYRLSGTDKTT